MTMYDDRETCRPQRIGISMRTTSLAGKNHRLLHLLVIALLTITTLAPVASARILHADLGRWTRRDPLGYVDGWNQYVSTVSNPIKWSDPFGLDSPGCDAPLLGLSDCALSCCALHDSCFARNGCTQNSWLPWNWFNWKCSKCNVAVVACLAGCVTKPLTALTPRFYCACWGYWFTNPTDPCMNCDSSGGGRLRPRKYRNIPVI